MQVDFTPEQEAQLAKLATNAGTDAEGLVKDAALRLLDEAAAFPDAHPCAVPKTTSPDVELPLCHLGGVGSLHRRDIYDDAR